MADPAEEQLLGYLLGALEDSEQESFEKALDEDPELQRKLARTRKDLQPLWMLLPDYAPPAGLAARTCEFVASHREDWAAAAPDEPLERLPAPASLSRQMLPAEPVEAAQASTGWRGIDVAAAIAIFAAAVLLIFPAIQSSRFHYQVAACQDNFRQLYLALTQYSEHNQGYFPSVPQRGEFAFAGTYARTLLDGEFLKNSQCVVCPGSVLAERGDLRIPDFEELLIADPKEQKRIRELMGGSYGYVLGYIDVKDGRYRHTRNLRRPFFAIMADSPSANMPGHQSLNHAGKGQNVLFEDGHVLFLTTPRPDGWADDLFVNHWGYVGPGRGPDDAVVAASGSSPAAPRLTSTIDEAGSRDPTQYGSPSYPGSTCR